MAGNKAIIHCCVERDVYGMLIAHCERTGQTKTMAVKRAIRAYCEAGVEAAHAGMGAPKAGAKTG